MHADILANMFMRQLDYLVALAREKHFARAAQACHVSQPALSAGLRHLEDELGVHIVQRGRRYVGLTADGERLLEHARKVLVAWDDMRSDAAHARSEAVTGSLRVGAIPTTLPVI